MKVLGKSRPMKWFCRFHGIICIIYQLTPTSRGNVFRRTTFPSRRTVEMESVRGGIRESMQYAK